MRAEILYEDEHLLVCVKPAGMDSQASRGLNPDMVSEIRNYLKADCGKLPYVGVIHRLDRPVSGIMVYGKTQKASGTLSNQVKNHQMKKIYYAVLCGKPVDKQGELVDYLWKDGKTNTSRVVKADQGKKAVLKYRILGVKEDQERTLSLAEIDLQTGRHHQIRVQFSHFGFPLLGDTRYQKEESDRSRRDPLALAAVGLGFRHPETGKWMEFKKEPEQPVFLGFHNLEE